MSLTTKSLAAAAAVVTACLVACAAAPVVDDSDDLNTAGGPSKPDKGTGAEGGTSTDDDTGSFEPVNDGKGADAGRDASTDAKPDAKDAGKDSGKDSGKDAGMCAPGSVSALMPTWHAPNVQIFACMPNDIDAFYTACLDSTATPATCSANAMANAQCYDCILSDSTEATWGALVSWPSNVVDLNVGGCFKAKDPTSDACPKAYEAEQECQHLACDASCGAASSAEYDACVTAASQGGCAMHADAHSTQCASLLPITEPCVAGTTFEERFKSIAKVFCYF